MASFIKGFVDIWTKPLSFESLLDPLLTDRYLDEALGVSGKCELKVSYMSLRVCLGISTLFHKIISSHPNGKNFRELGGRTDINSHREPRRYISLSVVGRNIPIPRVECYEEILNSIYLKKALPSRSL